MATYKSPPSWALKLLQKVCPDYLLEEVEGDLYEAFQWRAEEKGLDYARRKYVFEVIRCFKFLKINVKTQNNTLMLLNNYFKTGIRFLWRTRGYSTLNILGLALGIAISWMAYLFVTDEYSFDGFYDMADRTYRIKAHIEDGEHSQSFAGSSYIMGEEYPKQIPGIQYASRYKNAYFLTRSEENYLNLTAHYADKDFFEMFDVSFLIGSEEVFDNPDKLVISESTAERYSIPLDLSKNEMTFIRGGEEYTYQVTGIFKDFPLNTSVRPEAVFPFNSWANLNERRTTIWFDINMNTFFTLNENADPEAVSEKMTAVLLENDDFENWTPSMGLQPLKEIHLDPNYRTGNGVEARGDNEMILITIIIGIFCLLIACVNYANFAVGNYLVRIKEVSLRKVFGAERGGVFKQFVTEAFISTSLALILSIGFIYIILPAFAEYAGKTYDINSVFSGQVILGGFYILAVTTLLAGVYPALLLSRFKTVSGLKGKSKLGGKNWLSRGLIILQFCIAVFLIAGMLTLDKQLSFMLNYDIGYQGENVISVFRPITDDQTKATFKNELLKIPGVEIVSSSSGFNGTTYDEDDGETVRVRHARVDEDYIKTLGMELVAGRNFDTKIPTDLTKAIIVNEAFVKDRNLANPIGEQINFEYDEFKNPTIIGVVKNFNFESLHRSIEPLVMYMGGYLDIYDTQIRTSAISQELIEQVDAVHAQFFSPYQLNYTLVEDDIARQYELESNIQSISRGGAIVAILLSCIGLMGFVGTQIRQKLKEVSIRKVVGASNTAIFSIYVKRYLTLLIIGSVVGLSVAYYIMMDWLENYTYSVDMGWFIGVTALVGVLAVAILTIFSQLFRAMRANPVKYLKEE